MLEYKDPTANLSGDSTIGRSHFGNNPARGVILLLYFYMCRCETSAVLPSAAFSGDTYM